jgi:hypothetical protein
MSPAWTRRGVLEAFERWRSDHPELSARLDAESREYVNYHAARYARLLDAVQDLVQGSAGRAPLHILDVGPNIQTALLRDLHPGVVVDTLGFDHPAAPPSGRARHIDFDLNQTPDRTRWPEIERRYDVIVLAEVLEHLYVPARAVLSCLAEHVRRPGFIVLQTPNAAALHKRLELLRGQNPVEAPRLSRENPGHLHEYTLGELGDQVHGGGLAVEWLRAENYFGSGPAAGAYRTAGRLLPRSWRHGVTLCARADG